MKQAGKAVSYLLDARAMVTVQAEGSYRDFWQQRLGFSRTIEVPADNGLGFAAFSDAPNPRLQSLGLSVSRYLGQIAAFVSFSTETAPFPLSDWPSTAA